MLDDLDLAVIAALQDDSRRSFTSVAEELGVAEGTVRSRVNRMKRLDILDFGLDIDPQVLDRVCVYVCVWVRGPLMSRTIQKIADIPEVSWLVSMASGFDLLAEVICPDHKEMLRVLHNEIREVPGVDRAEAYSVLATHKSSLSYLGLDTKAWVTKRAQKAAAARPQPRSSDS